MGKVRNLCGVFFLVLCTIFACAPVHYDAFTYRDYAHINPESLYVSIYPPASGIDIICNFEKNGMGDFEPMYRQNIESYLPTYLMGFSQVAGVAWAAAADLDSFSLWKFELDDLELVYKLPEAETQVEFSNTGADVILFIDKIVISYQPHKTRDGSPNIRDYYHAPPGTNGVGTGGPPAYYFEVKYVFWDNHEGDVISFGKRLYSAGSNIMRNAPALESAWKKHISDLAFRIVSTTPFSEYWKRYDRKATRAGIISNI